MLKLEPKNGRCASSAAVDAVKQADLAVAAACR